MGRIWNSFSSLPCRQQKMPTFSSLGVVFLGASSFLSSFFLRRNETLESEQEMKKREHGRKTTGPIYLFFGRLAKEFAKQDSLGG